MRKFVLWGVMNAACCTPLLWAADLLTLKNGLVCATAILINDLVGAIFFQEPKS